MTTPRPKTRGERFLEAMRGTYSSSRAEEELLTQAARTLDLLDELERASRPVVVPGSKGQVRLNPALAGIRSAHEQLVRLIDGLGLPEGEAPVTARQVSARKAAAARWAQ